MSGIMVLVVAVVLIAGSVFAQTDNENNNYGSTTGGNAIGGMMGGNNGLHLGQLGQMLMMNGNGMKLGEGFDTEIQGTQESVIIQPNGNFRVTGATVNSVNSSANTINASIYGFSRDVNVAGATIYGGGKQIALTDMQSGDKIVASGTFSESTHVITVQDINDVSYTSRNASNIQSQIQALMQQVQQLQQQLKALLQGVGGGQ